MPISDKKKCQTLINLCASAAEQLQSSAEQLLTYRTAYTSKSIDPTGTPLQGNVTAVSYWIDQVNIVANAAVADAMIAAKVPTHANNALEV